MNHFELYDLQSTMFFVFRQEWAHAMELTKMLETLLRVLKTWGLRFRYTMTEAVMLWKKY